MNKVFKVIRKILVGFLVFLLGYLIVFSVTSLIPVNKHLPPVENPVTVYLTTNGVHTDFVLPAKNSQADWVSFLDLKMEEDSWVAVGWGDRGFYLNTPEWKDLKLKTALEAVSGLGEAALHITLLKNVYRDEQTVQIEMGSAEYQKLVAYIQSYFVLNEKEETRKIETNSYGIQDYFFEAHGRYNAFFTCNTWVNQGLKVANQKAALWCLTDTGIFRHYNKS